MHTRPSIESTFAEIKLESLDTERQIDTRRRNKNTKSFVAPTEKINLDRGKILKQLHGAFEYQLTLNAKKTLYILFD